MAAVIAHEVKNPLAAVRGAIQVIGGGCRPKPATPPSSRKSSRRIDGLNDLIQDLLVFARPPEPKLAPIDLRAVLGRWSSLLKRDPAFAGLEVGD